MAHQSFQGVAVTNRSPFLLNHAFTSIFASNVSPYHGECAGSLGSLRADFLHSKMALPFGPSLAALDTALDFKLSGQRFESLQDSWTDSNSRPVASRAVDAAVVGCRPQPRAYRRLQGYGRWCHAPLRGAPATAAHRGYLFFALIDCPLVSKIPACRANRPSSVLTFQE